MANGTNYAKFIAPSPGSYMGAEYNGRVIADYDNYTFASSAIGTVVNIGVLRPGEVFLGGYLRLEATLGASSTLQVGDAGDDDRYLAATASTAAGTIMITRAGASLGLGYKNETSSDIPIVLKTAGAETTGRVDSLILKARQ